MADNERKEVDLADNGKEAADPKKAANEAAEKQKRDNDHLANLEFENKVRNYYKGALKQQDGKKFEIEACSPPADKTTSGFSMSAGNEPPKEREEGYYNAKVDGKVIGKPLYYDGQGSWTVCGHRANADDYKNILKAMALDGETSYTISGFTNIKVIRDILKAGLEIDPPLIANLDMKTSGNALEMARKVGFGYSKVAREIDELLKLTRERHEVGMKDKGLEVVQPAPLETPLETPPVVPKAPPPPEPVFDHKDDDPFTKEQLKELKDLYQAEGMPDTIKESLKDFVIETRDSKAEAPAWQVVETKIQSDANYDKVDPTDKRLPIGNRVMETLERLSTPPVERNTPAP